MMARRAREIGIRTALGASIRDNVWLVLKEGLWLIAVAACIGLALSLLIGRVLRSLLYEVGPFDRVVLLAAPLLLAAVSRWVTWIPARRVARVDPLAALRSEQMVETRRRPSGFPASGDAIRLQDEAGACEIFFQRRHHHAGNFYVLKSSILP